MRVADAAPAVRYLLAALVALLPVAEIRQRDADREVLARAVLTHAQAPELDGGLRVAGRGNVPVGHDARAVGKASDEAAHLAHADRLGHGRGGVEEAAGLEVRLRDVRPARVSRDAVGDLLRVGGGRALARGFAVVLRVCALAVLDELTQDVERVRPCRLRAQGFISEGNRHAARSKSKA